MANVLGTTGNDYIHPDDATPTPSGYTNDTQYASQGDDYIDASQGGTDSINGGGGNDYIYMGATLTDADVISGSDGADTLALAGNYVGTSLRNPHGGSIFFDTSITFTQASLSGIEKIALSDASGDKYNLTLSAGADYGSSLTIDASGLATAPLTVDASAFGQSLDVEIGTGAVTLQGGTYFNVYDFLYAPTSNQVIHGSVTGNDDNVNFLSNAAQSISLDNAHFSNIERFVFEHGAYTVTAAADLVPTGSQGYFSGYYASSLSFSADPATLTSLGIEGSIAGDDTLIGGGGSDQILARGGNVSASGEGGDDFISATVQSGNIVRIDGGAGSDTVTLSLVYDSPVTFDAASLTSVENLTLEYNNSTPGHVFSATFGAGSVASGETLAVSLVYSLSPIDLNAQAITDASFVFTTQFYPNAGNIIDAGGGNDVFILTDPNATSGASNQWDGGLGINTLDYSSDTHSLAIDAALGTAKGTGTVADDFANFQVFKFGTGTVSFNGAENAETVYMDKSGTATFHGNGGNDAVYLGGTLDAFDFIDGGAGNDTVVLSGDYSAGVTLNSYTLTNVETLKLQHLSGEPVYSYKLTMNDGNVAAGATLAVDGSALPAGGTLTFDGSAELDGHFSLRGGAGADTLTGGHLADTLNGGVGADSMVGGAGNDLFYVDNAGDKTIEAVGGGTDTVFSSTSYALQTGQSIELLATTSRAGTGAINLTGNELAQRIDGNYGNNILNGHGGGDTLYGFQGNDTFYVSSATDKVFESADQGSDTVFASVSYTLQNGQSVEYLATTSRLGTGTITLTGNEQAQRIDGNYGVNGLYGGDGNDTLYGFDGNDRLGGGNGRDLMDGGNGNDIFTYSAVIQSTGVNRDLIQNMNFAQDKFDLPAIPTGIDTKVIVGTLSDASFDTDLVHAIGAAQLAAHHAVLFDPSAGTDNIAGHMFLIVDVNGVAGYQAGADYVIELQAATGTLTLGDFT